MILTVFRIDEDGRKQLVAIQDVVKVSPDARPPVALGENKPKGESLQALKRGVRNGGFYALEVLPADRVNSIHGETYIRAEGSMSAAISTDNGFEMMRFDTVSNEGGSLWFLSSHAKRVSDDSWPFG